MTFSFQDVLASISGPGGSFSLGAGSGNAEEGITIETNERTTQTVGADGRVVTTLIADRTGTIKVSLMKTSPVNQLLSNLFNFQMQDSTLVAQNTIVITNIASGDTVTCSGVSFVKHPAIKFGKDPGNNEFEFKAQFVDYNLGVYPN